MVQTHRESPRPTTRTEPEQTATQRNQTVRCQPDHNNVEHYFGQDCTELVVHDFFLGAILIAKFRSVQWSFLWFTLLWNDDLLRSFGREF